MANLTIAAAFTDMAASNTIVRMGKDLTVTGNVTVASGVIDSPTNNKFLVPNAASTFTFSGGTIALEVKLGSDEAHPTLTINGSADKTIESGTFRSYANATWTGTGDLVIKSDGVFRNQLVGVFDIQTDADIKSPGETGSIRNSGTMKKTAGTGATAVQAVFTNFGQLRLDSGTMDFTSTFTQELFLAPASTVLNGGSFSSVLGFNLKGGTLEGNGTITGSVYSDGGEVIPGIDGFPGELTITAQYSMTSTSQLTINLTDGGTSSLNVPNAIPTLAGTLRVNRSANYKPAKDTILTIVGCTSFAGEFSEFDAPNNAWTVGNDLLGFQTYTQRGPFELIVALLSPQGGNG